MRNGEITSLACVRIHSDSKVANNATRNVMPCMASITLSLGVSSSRSDSALVPNLENFPAPDTLLVKYLHESTGPITF